MQQLGDAQQFDRFIQGDLALRFRHPFYAVFKVSPYIQMGKQAGLLEYVAKRSAMRRHEPVAFLPDLIADFQESPGNPFKPRDRPQEGGFATARRAKQRGNAPCGDAEADVQ